MSIVPLLARMTRCLTLRVLWYLFFANPACGPLHPVLRLLISVQCSDIDPNECTTLGVDSQGYVSRVNIQFQKIGLLGTTLLSASGDSGAHGRTDEECFFDNTCHPAFPASSPFVTAVGGTQLWNGTQGANMSTYVWCVCTCMCVSVGG